MDSIRPILAYASRALAASLLLSALAPVRAGVIVVDPQGFIGGQLLDQAIQGASDGDVILLRPGDYTSLHLGAYLLGDKSLTLVADGAGTPIVLSGVRVQGLSAGRTVRLRGLEVRPVGASSSAHALAVVACDGLVLAEDCILVGMTPPPGVPAAGIGAFLQESAQVLLARCTIRGGDGSNAGPSPGQWAGPGAAGVMMLQLSAAALFDCAVVGGRGGDGDVPLVMPDGGPGVRLLGGDLFASGCTLTGGDEGVSSVLAPKPGSGIFANPGSLFDEARLRDTTVAAGAVIGLGTPAPDIVLDAAALVTYPAAARSLSLPAPLRESQAAALTIGGLPGDLVFVLASLRPNWALLDLHQGVLVLGAPMLSVVVATISDPGGQLVLPFITPKLPAAVAGGLAVGLQAVHFGSDGVTLGAPASAVWIDAAF